VDRELSKIDAVDGRQGLLLAWRDLGLLPAGHKNDAKKQTPKKFRRFFIILSVTIPDN